MKKLICCTFVLSLISVSAYSHSGRTNSSGCHNDYQNGGYHCHRGDHQEVYQHNHDTLESIKEKNIEEEELVKGL